MPITKVYQDELDEYVLEIGEPDRVDGKVKLWGIARRAGDLDPRSLGLVRVGGFDYCWDTFWYTRATWPMSWLLQAYYWPTWHYILYRIVVKEILGRHLYLVDWSRLDQGYRFSWHTDFKPFRWVRRLMRLA